MTLVMKLGESPHIITNRKNQLRHGQKQKQLRREQASDVDASHESIIFSGENSVPEPNEMAKIPTAQGNHLQFFAGMAAWDHHYIYIYVCMYVCMYVCFFCNRHSEAHSCGLAVVSDEFSSQPWGLSGT